MLLALLFNIFVIVSGSDNIRSLKLSKLADLSGYYLRTKPDVDNSKEMRIKPDPSSENSFDVLIGDSSNIGDLERYKMSCSNFRSCRTRNNTFVITKFKTLNDRVRMTQFPNSRAYRGVEEPSVVYELYRKSWLGSDISFTNRLLKQILINDRNSRFGTNDRNIAFSSYGIRQALGMLLEGASGDTFHQLVENVNMTYFSQKYLVGRNLRTANALFMNQENRGNILSDYIERIRTSYRATIFAVDFSDGEAAAESINRFVATRTRNRTREIVTEEDFEENLSSMIVNTVHYRNNWIRRFYVRHDIFYLATKKTKRIPFIYASDTRFNYVSNDRFVGVRIPYENNQNSLYLFMMNDHVPVDEFLNMGVETIIDIIAIQKRTDFLVSVKLPKFRIAREEELKEVLTSMGMGEVFENLDVTRMTNEELTINKILHHCTVDVDENGTEASAATAMDLRVKNSLVPAYEVVFNRPFLFYIVNDITGKIMFAGHVSNPQ